MKLDQLTGSDLDAPADAGAIDVHGLTADSREVRPGDLFAAMPGTVADGARFARAAVEAGAVAVLAADGAALDLPDTVPVVRSANPRRVLALMAARFFSRQPGTIAAVTGTNGKTSVASFLAQIWAADGHDAATIGTLGVMRGSSLTPLAHTSPDPVKLHSLVDRLAGEGVTHLALEASSHGLAQFRLDGVRLAAAAFTNLSRDHLDYHASFDDYFASKARLFSELLPSGAPAVLHAGSAESARLEALCAEAGLAVHTVGEGGGLVALKSRRADAFSQAITVEADGRTHDLKLPLVGGFQVANALVAAGLAMVTGTDADKALAALEGLKGARGRLELAGTMRTQAAIFIDYAHTPDALENALSALRPHTENRLVVVFGCGGDRDAGKRPQMGAVAARLADVAYVTDDNPRTENPEIIRRQIMAECPGGIEIGDRAKAIHDAVAKLGAGDILLVAGKGHETGQIVGKEIRPFSDHDVVAAAIGAAEHAGGSH